MSSKQWLSRDLWIIAAGFAAAMHVGKLPSAVPVLQHELNISFVQAGLLLSLVQCAGMLFALSLGSYAEKLGLKRCVLTGLTLLSLASAMGSMAGSVQTLLVLRLVEGAGFLLITLSGPAYIRQLVPLEQLQAKMGLWSAYMGGGMGIALLLTPYLISMTGWQGAWQFFAVLSALLMLMIYRYVPAAEISTKSISISSLIMLTLRHKPAWMLAGIFAVYAGQWFSLVGFLPVIYQQNHVSSELSGMLTAVVAVSNAAGTFACGLMLQRGWAAKTLVQTGFVILCVCVALFYICMPELVFSVQYALVLIFSLSGGLVAAVVFSQALHFAASAAAISSTIGLILQCSASSQFLLPPLVAMIVSQTHSWLWVGVFMAVLSLVGYFLNQRLFAANRSEVAQAVQD